MTKLDLMNKVKDNLGILSGLNDLIISDTIIEVGEYCNITDFPDAIEPFVRKKVKTIMSYEKEGLCDSVFDVKSLREGDTTITYNVDDKTSKETIYGLSLNDKSALKRFRRLR